MAEQKRKETKSIKPQEAEAQELRNSQLTKRGEQLKKEMDALVDDIDGLLEENAEEFVASYVQRGGQ
jgi:prokaryotic ubiquitin-like protein Pup